MQRSMIGLVLIMFHFAAMSARGNDLDRDEEVVFFPTAALLDPDAPNVTFFVHGWVYEPEDNSLRRQVALKALVKVLDLDDDAATQGIFVDRARRFLVDNESSQQLVIRVGPREVTLSKSEDNGHIRALLTLPTADAQRLLKPAAVAPPTLSYRAVTSRGDARLFAGTVHLLSPEGWSVVSDIDDTIKVSNVLDRRELMRNTMLREFQAVDGMAAVYVDWQREGAAFHYVTGSPWQLYQPLEEFVQRRGFPAGSFTMRYFRVQDGSAVAMLSAPETYKRTSIETLLRDFPRRKFALVGDTGEKDPEIYGDLARRFPQQVRFVGLRNITNDTLESDRMKAALRDVPAERTLLFREPSELPKLGPPPK